MANPSSNPPPRPAPDLMWLVEKMRAEARRIRGDLDTSDIPAETLEDFADELAAALGEANGWEAVMHALDEAEPTWRFGGGPLRGLAVEAIHRLASRGEATSTPAGVAGNEKDQKK